MILFASVKLYLIYIFKFYWNIYFVLLSDEILFINLVVQKPLIFRRLKAALLPCSSRSRQLMLSVVLAPGSSRSRQLLLQAAPSPIVRSKIQKILVFCFIEKITRHWYWCSTFEISN